MVFTDLIYVNANVNFEEQVSIEAWECFQEIKLLFECLYTRIKTLSLCFLDGENLSDTGGFYQPFKG